MNTLSNNGQTSSTTTQLAKEQWLVHDIPQDCGLLPTIGVLFWIGWLGILPWLFVLTFLFGSFQALQLVLATCILSLILPRYFLGDLGMKIGDWLVWHGAKYFGLKTTIEDPKALLELSRQQKTPIFSLEPHHLLPFSAVAFHPVLKRIPGYTNCCVLISSAIFQVPFMRQVFSWTHGFSADKKTFRSLLKKKRPPVLIPGGVHEVTLMDPLHPDHLTLYLNKRKGFIKLALENGSPIVPAFSFHLDECYGFWLPSGKLYSNFARILGFAPVFFWGRHGIPLGLPKPKKVHVVIGSPIDVPHEGEFVKEESIEKYHKVFLIELTSLYERHKHTEGYGNKTLIIT